MTRRDAFGLHLAEGLSLETFGAMGMCAAHCATLREAIGRAVRHRRSLTNGAEVPLRLEGR